MDSYTGHTKYRSTPALTSSSYYQPSPYSRVLRQNDYSPSSRMRHSELPWRDQTRKTDEQRKSRLLPIALTTAAFIVVIVVLAIAGLALYMGALRTDASGQLLFFSGSAKVLRGDRFFGHSSQEKLLRYKRQLEALYRKSLLGAAVVACTVDRFGNDSLTVYFRISLNKRKIPRSMTHVEAVLRDILLNDAASRRPVFGNIRFDPRSVQIGQILGGEIQDQRVITKPKENAKSSNGVLLKPTYKRNASSEWPMRRKTTTSEPEFKDEELPVIQGSFQISKTEADITEKKNVTTSQRPATKKASTLRETSVTSAFYKIGTAEKQPKPSTSKPPSTKTITTTTKPTTSSTPSSTTPFTSPTTPIDHVKRKTMVYITPADVKSTVPINQFLFTIPPHSLDKEPWVPIRRETEYTRPINRGSVEVAPKPTVAAKVTVAPAMSMAKSQPIYTSFTNPGLSFHTSNMETLGSTSILSHPLPVDKIAEAVHTDLSSVPTIRSKTAEIETRINQQPPVLPGFVEIETIKYVPGSGMGNADSLLKTETGLLPDKVYNNTLKAVIVTDAKQHPTESAEIMKQEPTPSSSVTTTYATTTLALPVTEPSGNSSKSGDVEEVREGLVEALNAEELSLLLNVQPSTKAPLVTLMPVKSNSGVGKPLRPRPRRPTNYTETRSFPTDPFEGFSKFVETEVVTSVSTEINKIKVKLNDFKISGVLNFKQQDGQDGLTTVASGGGEESKPDIFVKLSEITRNPKMGTEPLTEEKLRHLSEISKLSGNLSNGEATISNKAVSASYTINQAGFKILTKTLNKISVPTRKEEQGPVIDFSSISSTVSSNKTECNNFTIKCGDGQCISDTTRCNQLMDCNDGADEKGCNCADYLRSQFLLRKICDGVVDCWDFSDENLCEWCKPGQYVCGNSKHCIDHWKICDGVRDCPGGDDERRCFTVSPTLQAADEYPYHYEGYLMVKKHGRWGKLCVEGIHKVISKSYFPWGLSDLGQAVCKSMTYQNLDSIERTTEPDVQNDVGYYELSYAFQNSTKSSLTFKESLCSSKQIIKLKCHTLECGVRPLAAKQFARRMYRIVGGSNAGLGSWPWQAALYKEGEFQCGATLVSDRWLLSAGHCFFHSLDEHWVARLGALRRGTALPSPYEQLRHIMRIILHPDYVDAGFINDISLLQMESPVIFSDYVRPICLPPANSTLRDSRMCTVIGWGQLFEVGRIFPDTLQEVQVPIISTTECRKRTVFLPLYRVTDDMFCAGFDRGGRDACLGDSGGPLMCPEPNGRWVLQGITSNGYGCARANRPGVYTKVANYVSWMNVHMLNSDSKGVQTRTSTCSGHRCPLGECLPKSRMCNGFIECSDGSDENDCPEIQR